MRQILIERTAAGCRQPVLGPGQAAVERLVAGDIARFLELAGMDAEVAVRRVEQTLQLVERQAVVDRERADDAKAKALVNHTIERERRPLGGGGWPRAGALRPCS